MNKFIFFPSQSSFRAIQVYIYFSNEQRRGDGVTQNKERILKGTRLKRDPCSSGRHRGGGKPISPKKSDTPVLYKSLYSSTSPHKKLHYYKRTQNTKQYFIPRHSNALKIQTSLPVLSHYREQI